jgi:hypothetical protein
MRMQKAMSKSKVFLALGIGGLVAIAVWVSALRSDQYAVAKRLMTSNQLRALTGEVKISVLTGFNITRTEGRTSNISIYILGARERGWLRVEIDNTALGSHLKAATFEQHNLTTLNE